MLHHTAVEGAPYEDGPQQCPLYLGHFHHTASVVSGQLRRSLASLVLELQDGVGVTWEVRLHRFMIGENGGREAGKMLGWVTRGGESEFDVGVGVTLEVSLHRFKKS